MTTVLIVDDHPTFRATARMLLEAEGYGAPAPSEVEYWIGQARCLDVVELGEETRADRIRHWVPR